jgi:hypothetical protein
MASLGAILRHEFHQFSKVLDRFVIELFDDVADSNAGFESWGRS